VLDIIKACELVSGHKVTFSIVERRPGDAPELVADPRKLKTRLGWKPQYPNIEDIVRTAWMWHKNEPDGYEKK
jgi:UDP-glucose 4-epimerase